jgi:hypothetical protein
MAGQIPISASLLPCADATAGVARSPAGNPHEDCLASNRTVSILVSMYEALSLQPQVAMSAINVTSRRKSSGILRPVPTHARGGDPGTGGAGHCPPVTQITACR